MAMAIAALLAAFMPNGACCFSGHGLAIHRHADRNGPRALCGFQQLRARCFSRNRRVADFTSKSSVSQAELPEFHPFTA
jgi:hypothetical protein